MLEPLKQWVCDSCGQVIESSRDGWVEWKEEGEDLTYNSSCGFKIVHDYGSSPRGSGGCFTYSEDIVADNHLEYFVGEKGYIYLLDFLDMGPYIMRNEDYKGPRVKDMREFIEFMRRLTIPYYEEARLYFDEALVNEDLDPSSVSGIYFPENLKRLIEIYGRF